jgi:hypothetical protein
MAVAHLKIERVVQLVDELSEPLIERLEAAGADAAGRVRQALAPSNPLPVPLLPDDWDDVRSVLDAWAEEQPLHPRLEQLRQFLAPQAQ